MMGVTHVLGGMLAGALTLPAVGGSGVQQTIWVGVCGGAALLPDLDTPTSTASRMWGPISQHAANGIGAVAQGHRWGTHDLVLAPVVVFAAAAAAVEVPWAASVLIAVVVGLTLAAFGSVGFGRLGAGGNIAVSAGAGWASQDVISRPEMLQMLPAALAVGVVAHILGDAVTRGGIPIPLVWIRVRRRILGSPLRTGGLVEMALIAPALTLVLCWVVGRHSEVLPALQDAATAWRVA